MSISQLESSKKIFQIPIIFLEEKNRMEIGHRYLVTVTNPAGSLFQITANREFNFEDVVYLGREPDGVRAHKFWLMNGSQVVRVNPRMTVDYQENEEPLGELPQALRNLLNPPAASPPANTTGGKRTLRKKQKKNRKAKKQTRRNRH